DRFLEASRLDPQRNDLLERAKRLAAATDAHAELAFIHERLYKNAASDEERIRHLLDAARIADLGQKDREQAMRHLARALALTERAPALSDQIEELARELDRARPELGRD